MTKTKKIFLAIVVACIGTGGICMYSNDLGNYEMNDQTITTWKTCSSCKGSGKKEIRKTHAGCMGKGCGICDYKGYEVTTYECSACEGRGKIKEVRKMK